jgi:hypothetical protein
MTGQQTCVSDLAFRWAFAGLLCAAGCQLGSSPVYLDDEATPGAGTGAKSSVGPIASSGGTAAQQSDSTLDSAGGAILASAGSIATGGSGGQPLDGGLDNGAPELDGASDVPACIALLISAARSGPVGNPPMSYDHCAYRGQPVYYAPPQCCDQFSNLYATDCTVICAPDGGFIGDGDGRCPDFDHSTCTLLWRDSRAQ